MEEELDRSTSYSSDPSDDDELDRAIEAARLAASAPRQEQSELEEETDDRDDEENPNVDGPGEDNDTDEDEVDEANTPTEDSDDVDTTPQESRKTKPTRQGQEGSDDSDNRGLSRKERGKIIEEYRQELVATQEREAKLREQVEQQEREDATLTQEVSRALGTDAEYEKAVEDGLAGDREAAEKAQIWKNNRAFYRKLVKSAGKTYQQEFAKSYFDTLNELEGVDMKVVTGRDLTEIVRHIHEAGSKAAESKYKSQIEKLKNDAKTWEGRAKSGGPKNASQTKRSPITGGGGPVQQQTFDWEKHYLKDGLPTDEFESLVRQHGFEAAASGKFYKRGK